MWAAHTITEAETLAAAVPFLSHFLAVPREVLAPFRERRFITKIFFFNNWSEPVLSHPNTHAKPPGGA